VRTSALLALGATMLAGCGVIGDPPAPEPRVAATATPELRPAGTAGRDAAVPTSTPVASAGMNEAAFWGLIDETRQVGGGNTERQSGLLEERLTGLPAQQIAEFGRIYDDLDQRAYTWDLWGAAYLIEDGCSDDCFRDFRAYLISLGQGPYRAALRDPDSIAPVVDDAEAGDWENADDVAPDAYEQVAGEDIPSGDSDVSGKPRGEPWDDEQQDELVRRYPGLAARFR
jgi:Protein of unknown function (DUF4240)